MRNVINTKKITCLVLAAVILSSAQKGGGGDFDRETIPKKQVSAATTPKTVQPFFKNAADIESMTDEQLLSEVYKANRFDVADFHVPDDFGVGLQDGEIWHHAKINSVSSREAAEKEVNAFASAQNTGEYIADYIGENDYYHEFRLKYTRLNTENLISMRIIVYKESAIFCAFNDKTGYYSEIRALNRDSVLYLLDIDTFFNITNWSSARVIHRDFKEKDNEYIYTYYTVSITEGDWELDNSAVLEKIKYGIDKTTGIKTHYDNNVVLKTAVIRGTAKKLILR